MDYIDKSKLSKRWSPKLIEQFFPLCTKEMVNPHYRHATPMQLYDMNKVRSIESRNTFKAEYVKALKRKDAAVKGVKKKRNKLIMYANGVQIEIPDFGKEDLIKKACDHYNLRHLFRSDYCYASPSCDEGFLKRISINYLRHKCTAYENELDKFYGKVGKQEAHDVLKERINEAIKQKYEWLR